MSFEIKGRKTLSFKPDDIYVFYDGLFQFFTFILLPDKLKAVFRIRVDKSVEKFAQEMKLNYSKFEFSTRDDVNYWIRWNPKDYILDIWDTSF